MAGLLQFFHDLFYSAETGVIGADGDFHTRAFVRSSTLSAAPPRAQGEAEVLEQSLAGATRQNHLVRSSTHRVPRISTMPGSSPPRPTHGPQSKRQNRLLIRLVLGLEEFPRGHADHARPTPCCSSFSKAATHNCSSEPCPSESLREAGFRSAHRPRDAARERLPYGCDHRSNRLAGKRQRGWALRRADGVAPRLRGFLRLPAESP